MGAKKPLNLGKKGVQILDGGEHHHRKVLFMSFIYMASTEILPFGTIPIGLIPTVFWNGLAVLLILFLRVVAIIILGIGVQANGLP